MLWKFSRLRGTNGHYGRIFFGDEIDRIREVDALTGEIIGDRDHVAIFPATHFMTNDDIMAHAIDGIQAELATQLKYFEGEGKLLEAQRLKQRTEYDIEMLKEMATPTVLKTIPASWMAVSRENHLTRYWISSRKISY